MSEQAYEAIELAKKTGKIKKGTNEVTKVIEKGKAKLVVVAQDVSPKEITMHIPLLCKDKNVPYVEVPSREELGAAAGMSVATVAVAITEPGEAKETISGFNKKSKEAPKEEKVEEPKVEEEKPAEAPKEEEKPVEAPKVEEEKPAEAPKEEKKE